MATLPALERTEDIAAKLSRQPYAVCLDFDGTLSEIRSHPEDAELVEGMRAAVIALTALCPVAIVTGRQLSDVRPRIGTELIYAASHGLEIQFPGEPAQFYGPAQDYRAAVARVAQAARTAVPAIPGLLIEHKSFSTAIHFRLVGEQDQARVSRLVADLAQSHPELRVLNGKMVAEFQPRLDWHKGKAVMALAERLSVPREGLIYIGDDVTDEDAFRELAGAGIGIVVREQTSETAARYHLRNPLQVLQFLIGLTAALRSMALSS
jgi:trehalose 6-phosphate phosphatase